MKRIIFIVAIACSSLVVMQSCSSTKNAAASTESTVKRGSAVGNWVLNNVSFDGIPSTSVKGLFGETSYSCFVGSTWRLTNSGNGSYTLASGSSCGAVTQNIFWSASAADQTFQFKKLNEKEKAKNVTEGYRLILAETGKDNLVLRSPVEYGSKTAYIVLSFSKAAK